METTEKALLRCPKCNEEFPAQGRGRYVHIFDVVRGNQARVGKILVCVSNYDSPVARFLMDEMKNMDRDAILQEGGILTDEQIELLK